MALLDVDNLSIAVRSGRTLRPVLHGLSFSVNAGETLGIVGESGCGKSLTSLAIMGLLEGTPVQITGGSIRFGERDLLAMKPAERRTIMGHEMSMIFQEPMTSLNPVYRVGDQIIEAVREHRALSKAQARERAIELLTLVKIPDPAGRIDSYPHQLSGGMRQRVMIAMALVGDPKLLIADEPTTALDVTVQAQILKLIIDLQRQSHMSVILISHDLGVIAETSDKVAVMYRGRIVEQAETSELFATMRHPYTRALMKSIPEADADIDRLEAIPGRVPMIDETITGCAFHPRCPKVTDQCKSERPAAVRLEGNHLVRCHYPSEKVQ